MNYTHIKMLAFQIISDILSEYDECAIPQSSIVVNRFLLYCVCCVEHSFIKIARNHMIWHGLCRFQKLQEEKPNLFYFFF